MELGQEHMMTCFRARVVVVVVVVLLRRRLGVLEGINIMAAWN